MEFEQALQTWNQKAQAAAAASEDYRVAFGKALSESQGKTEAARRAEADIATSALRRARDLAEIEADTAFHRMIHLRGAGPTSSSKWAAEAA